MFLDIYNIFGFEFEMTPETFNCLLILISIFLFMFYFLLTKHVNKETIMKTKNFFKQLFCKHEWEEKTDMEVMEDFGGVLQLLEEKRYKVCKKCGKVKEI